MTKRRSQKWDDDPGAYPDQVNAWLDADDAAQDAAMYDRFEPAEEVVRDEMNRLHMGPRMDIARAISDLRRLSATDPQVGEIHAAIERIVGDRRDLLEYAVRLQRTKRGPGNKSRRPRTQVDESDPWAKIDQMHEAEFMDHFAREAVSIYKRIKQRHRQLHFRRSGHDGLPDDLELAVDRALRIPNQDQAEVHTNEARKRRRSFRAKVLKAARGRLRGDAPGVRRGRKRGTNTKAEPAKNKRAPKTRAPGAR